LEERPHLNIVDTELLALSNTIPVDDNKRASIKVQASAITAKLIRVQINAATFVRSGSDELDSNTELPELVVAAAGITDYVHSV
jgi:hypothetical protein